MSRRTRVSLALVMVVVLAALFVIALGSRPSEEECRARLARQAQRPVEGVELQVRWAVRPRPGWRCVETFEL